MSKPTTDTQAYTLRYAERADFPAIKRLWGEVFGDGPEFVDEFLRTFWREKCCCAAFCGDALVAMGFCLTGPSAGGHSLGYIYSVATDSRHRGRGLATRVVFSLIATAWARLGADVVATLPASDSLYGWYQRTFFMTPCFVKGGEGVVFPDEWRSFSDYCGEHDPDTPSRLLAVALPDVSLDGLTELGWECTLD